MRFDAMREKHHHLYSSDSDRIDDYYDDELDQVLSDFFALKKIPGFSIEEVKLQIIGKFQNSNK